MSKLFAKLCCWSSSSERPSTSAYHAARPATSTAARGRRRVAQPDNTATTTSSSFHQQAREISQIQVGGIRRTPGAGTYISSYHSSSQYPRSVAAASTVVPTEADDRRASRQTDATLVADAEQPYVDAEQGWKKNTTGYNTTTSMWKGKPNGTEYDRRQELTEEDEDTWARLAM